MYRFSKKIAILFSFSVLPYLPASEWKWEIFPEIISKEEVTIALSSNHPFGTIFQDIAQTIFEAGFHIKNFKNMDEIKYTNEVDTKIITLSDIEHYFVIWLISILFPLSAFIGELIIGILMKKKKIHEQSTFEVIETNGKENDNILHFEENVETHTEEKKERNIFGNLEPITEIENLIEKIRDVTGEKTGGL
ncbi:hypothetical protein PVAND_017763 [Polypedilum vanderplanki]|uniref:Uncharacterized protein n=1 Tax=Polypedilum vanderplanki TaxID=319348 RepID=A0A9J6B873_POLVA|nr:hypothetical protein PVAND_017763 [Polypedilum vanderplanki]